MQKIQIPIKSGVYGYQKIGGYKTRLENKRNLHYGHVGVKMSNVHIQNLFNAVKHDIFSENERNSLRVGSETY